MSVFPQAGLMRCAGKQASRDEKDAALVTGQEHITLDDSRVHYQGWLHHTILNNSDFCQTSF